MNIIMDNRAIHNSSNNNNKEIWSIVDFWMEMCRKMNSKNNSNKIDIMIILMRLSKRRCILMRKMTLLISKDVHLPLKILETSTKMDTLWSLIMIMITINILKMIPPSLVLICSLQPIVNLHLLISESICSVQLVKCYKMRT